ncbi:hypothetical protein [Clostridium estertheticum]|uniref:hypothetical protein n=1 Tax=Clostridium estertheticum TaxID=238834 RepID=UPI001CF1366A|nr:hypothetical protein [Clostridium estertheticum]MCB2342513.1 hypothetical protein [Clostridium estertheticum]
MINIKNKDFLYLSMVLPLCSAVQKLFNLYSLHHARLMDIDTWTVVLLMTLRRH